MKETPESKLETALGLMELGIDIRLSKLRAQYSDDEETVQLKLKEWFNDQLPPRGCIAGSWRNSINDKS